MDWPLVDCYCCSNHTHRGIRAHGDMSARTAAPGRALLGPVDGDQNVSCRLAGILTIIHNLISLQNTSDQLLLAIAPLARNTLRS